MGARFEFQSPPLRLEGKDLVWVATNTGDTTAEPGDEVDTLQVTRRPSKNPYSGPQQVDTTPWQFEVPVNDTVEPGTAHSATYTLEWPGLDDGEYEVQVWLQKGANEISASLYITIERGWPHYSTG